MQKLIVPTNWDDALIPAYKSLGISECYGKLALDFVGGGRAGFILPDVGRRNVESHVRRLHDAGIQFNYLLNAGCTGFREFTRSGDRKLQELLRWLDRIEVDSVTVTSPYFLQVIKDRYPRIKVCASTNAEINSLQRAVFWDKLGADQLTLSHISLNRNFGLLRLIRKNVSCELRLIANSSCLFHCPLFRAHTSFDAHASQSDFFCKAGFSADYCNLFCKLVRLSDPVQFITSQWIRPEDLGAYESVGIDAIKLIDRRCSTEALIEICTRYSQRRYEGNLVDLLPTFHGKSPANKNTFFLKCRYFFHPREFNLFKIQEIGALVRNIDIFIDNRKLDNFIDKFIREDCSSRDCGSCGYCAKIAENVLSYDRTYLENLKSRHKKFLDDFVRGNVFHYT